MASDGSPGPGAYHREAIANLPDIVIAEDRLSVDGRSIAFDAVESVARVTRVMRASGVITDVIRRFELADASGRVIVKLDGAKVMREEKQALFAQLTAVSEARIEPGLLHRTLHRLAAEPLAVDRLLLSRDGFSWRGALRRRSHGWPEFSRAIEINDRIRVLVTPDGAGEERLLADIGAEAPNAVLLPRLMAACAARFASG